MSLFKKSNYKEIVLKIDGMRCGMCESHVNDIIRKNFDIKKVKASRKNNSLTISYENDVDVYKIKEILHSYGYEVTL